MIIFEVVTPLKKKIRLTERNWKLITNVKHPAMDKKQDFVRTTLENPDEIKQSKKDVMVYLYYKKFDNRWVAVICKHLNSEGFIITTYLTDRIKEGDIVWKKY